MLCFACLLVPGPLLHSALWQTTCLLIPFNAPTLRQVPSELDLLEQLLRSGCHLVAGRMSILDNEQRKHIAGTLKMSSRVNERVRGLALKENLRSFIAYFLPDRTIRSWFCLLSYLIIRWLIFPWHAVSSWLCKGKWLWAASSRSLKGVRNSNVLCYLEYLHKNSFFFYMKFSSFTPAFTRKGQNLKKWGKWSSTLRARKRYFLNIVQFSSWHLILNY